MTTLAENISQIIGLTKDEKEIVENAMANNWAGLYPIGNNGKEIKQRASNSQQEFKSIKI